MFAGRRIEKLKRSKFPNKSGRETKTCKFVITESAVRDCLKDFDSVNYKLLSVKKIENSFPPLFKSDLLRTNIVNYVANRIIKEGDDRGLTTVFHCDRKDTSLHEPNEYSFFIENDSYSFVKKMLKSDAVVRLERIHETIKKPVEKVVSSVKNKCVHKKVIKKTERQRKVHKLIHKTNVASFKRLKINNKNYIYVNKNSYELAQKAVTPCFVRIPKLSNSEKIFEDITVRQSNASPCCHVGETNKKKKESAHPISKALTKTFICSQLQNKKSQKKEVRTQQKNRKIPQKKMKRSREREQLHELRAENSPLENLNQNKEVEKRSNDLVPLEKSPVYSAPTLEEFFENSNMESPLITQNVSIDDTNVKDKPHTDKKCEINETGAHYNLMDKTLNDVPPSKEESKDNRLSPFPISDEFSEKYNDDVWFDPLLPNSPVPKEKDFFLVSKSDSVQKQEKMDIVNFDFSCLAFIDTIDEPNEAAAESNDKEETNANAPMDIETAGTSSMLNINHCEQASSADSNLCTGEDLAELPISNSDSSGLHNKNYPENSILFENTSDNIPTASLSPINTSNSNSVEQLETNYNYVNLSFDDLDLNDDCAFYFETKDKKEKPNPLHAVGHDAVPQSELHFQEETCEVDKTNESASLPLDKMELCDTVNIWLK